MLKKCPKCESDNVQKFEMAHMAGTSNLAGRVSGTSIGGTFGVGASIHSGTYSGTQQTELAKALAPPPNRVANTLATIAAWGFVLQSILFVVAVFYFGPKVNAFLMWLGASLIMFITIGGALLHYSNSDEARMLRAEFVEASYKWKNSYICYRCGTPFVSPG